MSVLAIIAFHKGLNTVPGGFFVGLRPAAELAAPDRAHATASPNGTSVGALPPSTPPWFPRLPCQ